MRTTLCLDPDVAVLISEEVAASPRPLKAVVNDRLRRGFADRPATEIVGRECLPRPLQLGAAKVKNFDNIAEILELIENDSR